MLSELNIMWQTYVMNSDTEDDSNYLVMSTNVYKEFNVYTY